MARPIERKFITEESGEHKAWLPQAKQQTLDTLPDFLAHLANDYHHDYGTIVHAMAAAAVGAVSALDKTESGGITGFQASCLGWKLIREYFTTDGPLRLMAYRELLYPQYDYKRHTLPPEVWEDLQSEARRLLAADRPVAADTNVLARWQAIADGVVPPGFQVDSEVA